MPAKTPEERATKIIQDLGEGKQFPMPALLHIKIMKAIHDAIDDACRPHQFNGRSIERCEICHRQKIEPLHF